eukprot:scaffold22496_cov95-Phaeocystis_antarctica.AAC.2
MSRLKPKRPPVSTTSSAGVPGPPDAVGFCAQNNESGPFSSIPPLSSAKHGCRSTVARVEALLSLQRSAHASPLNLGAGPAAA